MKYIFGVFIVGGVIFTAVWMFSVLFPSAPVVDEPAFTNFDGGVTDTGSGGVPPSPPPFEPLPEIDESFLSHPEVSEVVAAPGVYVFHTESTQTPEFQIEYHQLDQGFYVLLLSEPLKFTRQKAEAHLLQVTGKQPAELCALNVRVTAPQWVSEFFGGQNLGLSFCPGAQNL